MSELDAAGQKIPLEAELEAANRRIKQLEAALTGEPDWSKAPAWAHWAVVTARLEEES